MPAVEVLISTAFIRDCIMDKEKTHLIHGAIAQGTSQYGMQTFDQSIFSLYEQGLVVVRGGAALGVERRRVQAEGAGHLHDRRHGARPDGARRCQATRRASRRRSRGSAASGSELLTMTWTDDAYLAALKMLARRELSEAQVRQRLARARHDDPTTSIDAAVARLKADAQPRRRARGRRDRADARRRLRSAGTPARAAADRGRRHRRGDRRARRRRVVPGHRRRRAARRGAREAAARPDRIADDREFQRLYRYLIGQGFESDRVLALPVATRRRLKPEHVQPAATSDRSVRLAAGLDLQ